MNLLQFSEDQKSNFQKFRTNVTDVLQPHHDDRYLIKWLIARSYNLDSAEKMLRDHLKFCKEIHLESLVKTKGLREDAYRFTRSSFLGFSKSGHPVHLFNLGMCDGKGFARSVTTREWSEYLMTKLQQDVQRFKDQKEKTGRCVDTSVFLVDTGRMDPWQFLDKEVIRCGIQAIQVLQNNYPEFLEKIYVVNAPKVVYIIYNIFKPFMSERTISKIKIYEEEGWQEEFFSLVPESVIPAYLGGTREEPAGDPYCHAVLNWDSTVPKSMYLVNKCGIGMTTQDPGVIEKTLLPKCAFEVCEMITEAPSVLHWEFQTKGNDIKFGLYFENEAIRNEEPCLEELISCKVVNCHKIAKKGEYICEDKGKYILRFDNSHSWFTSKYLLYKTEIKSMSYVPTEE